MKIININKYDWVNSLRGYAILLVIMIHTSQHFVSSKSMQLITHTGDTGVQLFFVISSFTLFNSYTKRKKEDKKYIKRSFFIRRFFRIAPYYYLAGFIYISYRLFWENGSVDLLYLLANYTFTNGIFLRAIEYIPPGGWSVGTEMLFYLTVPFLFKYINSLKKAIWFLIIAIAISNVINIAARYYISTFTNIDWFGARGWYLYFWFPNQFPVFIYGIILFYIYKEIKISKVVGMLLLLFSIISFVFLASFEFKLTYPTYFFQREYVYGLLFMCFSIGLYSTKNSIITNKLTQKIGIHSFSMYLNHFIIIYVFSIIWNKTVKILLLNYNMSESVLKSDFLFVCFYVAVVITTYFVSKLTYKFIELNGVRLGNNLIEKYLHKKHIKFPQS